MTPAAFNAHRGEATPSDPAIGVRGADRLETSEAAHDSRGLASTAGQKKARAGRAITPR